MVFFVLQMLSGNRQEVRVDAEAARQSSLHAAAPAGQALLYIYREGFMGKAAVGWKCVAGWGNAAGPARAAPALPQTTLSPGSPHSGSQYRWLRPATPEQTRGNDLRCTTLAKSLFSPWKSKMGALSNTLIFLREADAPTALQKLSKVPMVAAERAAKNRCCLMVCSLQEPWQEVFWAENRTARWHEACGRARWTVWD